MNANPYSLNNYPTSVRTALWGTSSVIAGEQVAEIVAEKNQMKRITTYDEVEMRVQSLGPVPYKPKLLSEVVYVTMRVSGVEKWKNIPLFAFRKPTVILLDTFTVGQEIELIFKTSAKHPVLVTTVWKGKEAH